MVFGDGRKDRNVITINEEVRYDWGQFDDFDQKISLKIEKMKSREAS